MLPPPRRAPPTTLHPAARRLLFLRSCAARSRCLHRARRAAPLPPIPPQIYRAEHWSKQLGAKHAMPMLSMSLLMIAGISLAATAAAHPQRTLAALANPAAAAATLADTQ